MIDDCGALVSPDLGPWCLCQYAEKARRERAAAIHLPKVGRVSEALPAIGVPTECARHM
jgi:hypothetical protein